MVLLRRMICLQLQVRAKVGSSRLFLSLETLNNSIINDLTNRPYTSEMLTVQAQDKENDLLFTTTKLFNFVGYSDPVNKIYLTTQPVEGLPLIAFGILLNTVRKKKSGKECSQLSTNIHAPNNLPRFADLHHGL